MKKKSCFSDQRRRRVRQLHGFCRCRGTGKFCEFLVVILLKKSLASEKHERVLICVCSLFSLFQMVGSMLNFEDQAEILAYRNENECLINGMNESSFKGTLSDTIANGSDDGFLSLDEIQDVIFTVLPECSSNEMNALLTMLYDQDEATEKWKCDDLIEYGFQVLQQQREVSALRAK